MEVIAITREVSPSINRCELSFHSRRPIDLQKAVGQHRAYQECLARLGAQIVSLPAEPDLPDSVFVEDAAVLVPEVAVIPIMGAKSRRPETQSLVKVLSRYRPIEHLTEPATLDGGDVLQVDKKIFVGLTRRTNKEAVRQLRHILTPHGYEVAPVPVGDILHLKSACSWIGDNAILINRAFVEPEAFPGFELFDVPPGEPSAANALMFDGSVIISDAFPKTNALLKSLGRRVEAIDVSELQKAEAGVTCCSLILEH